MITDARDKRSVESTECTNVIVTQHAPSLIMWFIYSISSDETSVLLEDGMIFPENTASTVKQENFASILLGTPLAKLKCLYMYLIPYPC